MCSNEVGAYKALMKDFVAVFENDIYIQSVSLDSTTIYEHV